MLPSPWWERVRVRVKNISSGVTYLSERPQYRITRMLSLKNLAKVSWLVPFVQQLFHHTNQTLAFAGAQAKVTFQAS